MNGYKTSGDWADVTSIGRNEIVFEGRHKEYGAFYIRQRYSNSLLLALLLAIAFVGICAFVPYVFRGVVHLKPVVDNNEVVTLMDQNVVKPKVIIPNIPHPPVHPPKGPAAPQNSPPVITLQPIDSAPPVNDNHNLVITPGPVDKTGTSSDINPLPPGNPLPEPPVDNIPRTWVNEMPKFLNGKVEDYLAQNIQYPPDEIKLGVQGIVYATFIIEKDGSVSNVKLMRGISNGQDLNSEALRVISEMPKWSPGKQDGHPVRIQYILPIHFKLQ